MIPELKKRIENLIALYENERQRRSQAESELEQSRQDISACQEKIKELERQVDNLKLKSAFTSNGDNAAAKERIASMISQLDKCIARLER